MEFIEILRKYIQFGSHVALLFLDNKTVLSLWSQSRFGSVGMGNIYRLDSFIIKWKKAKANIKLDRP